MRGIKAEGGWGVVNTDIVRSTPARTTRRPLCLALDEGDVANMAAMVEAVHAHGALAGVELWHGGTARPTC